MEWFYFVNLAIAIWCWKVAQDCDEWSFAWWVNMTASALNGAVVLGRIF